ncbi:hypothetical protein Lal_00029522 [Lupinus albus]|uniref:Putative defensin, plant n=1 Tax=Lupinus albus TaxID=3870 RepID=A0A6A5MI01_LUPAL|nr:putative defensin, plant [Lupinus albus]KAF1873816.1 hypothetical protein Lal_00029522 [Lupinus albus]
MARSIPLVSTIFVILLLLLTTGMVAEAKTCESRSHKLKGFCYSSKRCAHVCTSHHNFIGGHCRGFIRRCHCTKPC